MALKRLYNSEGVCVCVCVCGGGDLYFNVACSVGVFFERAICSRHVETSRREEEMGPVLAPTVRVTISTLINSSTVINQRWRLAHPKYACTAGRLFAVPNFFVRSFRYTASYRHGYLAFEMYPGGGRRDYSSGGG